MKIQRRSFFASLAAPLFARFVPKAAVSPQHITVHVPGFSMSDERAAAMVREMINLGPMIGANQSVKLHCSPEKWRADLERIQREAEQRETTT